MEERGHAARGLGRVGCGGMVALRCRWDGHGRGSGLWGKCVEA